MRVHFDVWKTERERAELLPCGLRVSRIDQPTIRALLWRPRAEKPYAHYRFTTIERRDAFIAEQIRRFEAHEAQKRERRRTPADGDLSQCSVGSVFSYSWGYDQTNVEFWQVIARSGTTVRLRQIASETVQSSERHVRPRPDAFLEPKCGVMVTNEYGTNRCERSSRHACHFQDCGAFEHRYEPGEPEVITKRIRFSNGRPTFSMPHGVLTPVAVHRFANAAPLVVDSLYMSSDH
jgi:hypothetical protein